MGAAQKQEALSVEAHLAKQDWAIYLATGASFVVSVALWFAGDSEAGLFVGIWVPSLLAFSSHLKISARAREG